MMRTLNSDQDLFARGGETGARRLDETQFTEAFSPTPSPISIRCIAEKSNFLEPCTISQGHQLDEWLDKNTSSKIRILSIAAKYSFGPLEIPISAMQQLFSKLDVDPAFASVIAAFGEPPRASEPGLNCFFHRFAHDAEQTCSYDLCYLYRFMELDSRKGAAWRVRQIGVYHNYNKSTQSNTFIFLQPHKKSRFDGRLEAVCKSVLSSESLISLPFRMHELLIGTYFGGWRKFLRDKSEGFKEQSDKVFTYNIHKSGPAVSFETLQDWHELSDQIESVPARLEALSRLLQDLKKPARFRTSAIQPFYEEHQNMLQGILSSAIALKSRINGVQNLLASTIDSRNQEEAGRLNTIMLNLTKGSVDDSANVTVITFVTLFYLPATFIGTLFGMNLFVFNTTTKNIVVAKDFWLFVVLFVPLTLITFVSWKVLKQRADKKREQRDKVTINLI